VEGTSHSAGSYHHGTVSVTVESGVTQHTDAQQVEEAKEMKSEIMQTRFGAIEVFPERAITFERGLLGIPESKKFVLTDFKNENLEQFKLLQSLDNEALSFITLPLELDNSIIAFEDLAKAAEELSLAIKDLAVLTVVSVHRSPTKTHLSVNARAPLLVNVAKREAVQYVFQHSRYQVQQPLNLDSSE
jgi:flagellar assembly factor FliW